MIKTKKYGYGNLMFLNKWTLEKLKKSKIDLIKIRFKVKTLKDFKIVVREECEDNKVYFYVERFKGGEIIEYNIKDILK